MPGLVLTSPIWLYQLWAFIVPGLLAKEKKWALIFIGAATPLFAGGVLSAYVVLPKAIAVLLSFTQSGVTNLQDIKPTCPSCSALMVVFGIAFLIPLLVLMLNIVGVVKAEQLSQVPDLRDLRHIRLRCVATPSTDPFSMLALAAADDAAVPGRRGDRAHPRPAQGSPADGSGRTRPCVIATAIRGRPRPCASCRTRTSRTPVRDPAESPWSSTRRPARAGPGAAAAGGRTFRDGGLTSSRSCSAGTSPRRGR